MTWPRCRFAVPVILLLLTVSTARAEEYPLPKVDYSADMEMNMQEEPGGRSMTVKGRIFSARDKERQEMVVADKKTVIITRRDKGVAWVLMDDQKLYVESALDQMDDDPVVMMREGRIKMTRQGTEKVNGVSATKYGIESTDRGGGRFTGHIWMTDQNIPVRVAGGPEEEDPGRQIRIDYTHIQVSKQDAGLFEVPSGYRPVSMPKMPPAGGGPHGEMSDEEMQKQMQEMMKQLEQHGKDR